MWAVGWTGGEKQRGTRVAQNRASESEGPEMEPSGAGAQWGWSPESEDEQV